MPKIHELLQVDPSHRLVNHGQAQIRQDQSEELLRHELSTFVCEGHFADGLDRILGRFLTNRGGPHVEAAWVSGFFGSGKSHLLKMLAHLWTNAPLSDGASPRSLVPGGLPTDIAGHLREVDSAARRAGLAATAAAGTLLGGNERVRCAVLGIILRSRGLPTAIPAARFCLWLRHEGILDRVRQSVEAGGGKWSIELSRLKVSRRIAEAVLEAHPDFEESEQRARRAFGSQFPPQQADLTTDEFVDLARQTLSEGDVMPLTALVLDEAQQYIGNSERRASDFTEVAEALQTRFDGRVMLVASGQSALHATPTLQKLRDRFRIQIELDDTDVEAVTRKVLLGKKPSHRNAIKEAFQASEGEVSRHLSGTRLAAHDGDRKTRVEDYPLLATRRRFWSRCLRAVDQGGGAAQLRSQLRILDDALDDMGDRELGAVIRASELFGTVAGSLVGSGELPNEVNTRIQRLTRHATEGELRRNLAALAFLISKLPREPGVDAGVRADATTLADLLVEDITTDSGPFREQVERVLEDLAKNGHLLKLRDEYRIQTPEGAAWDQDFRAHRAKFRNDHAAIGAERDELLLEATQKAVAGLKIRHGAMNVARKVSLSTGSEPPDAAERAREIVVWARSGWECSRSECRSQARSFGSDDPAIHVFIPKDSEDRLRRYIVDALTARRVLDLKGTPKSASGQEAKAAMDSRLRQAQSERDAAVAVLLGKASVFLGGGDEGSGTDLGARLRTAADRSLKRLFPRFGEADSGAWGTAVKRARDKSEQPFEPVGWDKAAADHPVGREVHTTIGPGARGSEVRKKLTGPPFGWPRDAVDAALIALHSAEQLRATRNGEIVPPGQLKQATVNTTLFAPENVVLELRQKIALRGLFKKAGVHVAGGREAEGARRYLESMRRLAEQAGGPPPLPAHPVAAGLDDIAGKTGNEQLRAIHEKRSELERSREKWTARVDLRGPREAAWTLVNALHGHAESLDVHAEVGEQLEAIRQSRSLLGATDPVGPLIARLADPLRAELNRFRDLLAREIKRAATQLDADSRWQPLSPTQRHEIRSRRFLLPPWELSIGTHEAVRDELDRRSLSAWRAEVDAVPARLRRALDDLPAPPGPTPTTVRVRRTTIKDDTELRAWLDATERTLRDALQNGAVTVR